MTRYSFWNRLWTSRRNKSSKPHSRPSRSRRPLAFAAELLESRRLMAFNAFADLESGRVAFEGDEADDRIVLSVDAQGRLAHNRSGDPGFEGRADLDNSQPGVQSLLAADIAALTVAGGEGDDGIRFLGSVSLGENVSGADVRLNAETTFIDSLSTHGGDLASGGASFTARGAILAGDVDLTRQTGAVRLQRGLLGDSFMATSLDSLYVGRGLRTTAGDIHVAAANQIVVQGPLIASKDGAGAVRLRAGGAVSVEAVRADGGGFFVGSQNLAVGGPVDVRGGRIRLEQSGRVALGGDLHGGEIQASMGAFTTRPGVDLIATAGDVVLVADEGPILVMGAVRALNSGEGGVTIASPGAVMLGAVATDGGDISTRSQTLEVRGSIATRGGNVALNQAGAKRVGQGILTAGGDLSSSGTRLQVGGDVATRGGDVRLDHTYVQIRGHMSTRGVEQWGVLQARLRVESASPTPHLLVGAGNLVLSPESLIIIDVTAIEIEEGDMIQLAQASIRPDHRPGTPCALHRGRQR